MVLFWDHRSFAGHPTAATEHFCPRFAGSWELDLGRAILFFGGDGVFQLPAKFLDQVVRDP